MMFVADIPGIIEGASEGKGLGLRFLRHIERNSVLMFIVPADSDDIIKEYRILLNELRQYNPELLDKQRMLAVSKCDLVPPDELDKLKKSLDFIFRIFSQLIVFQIEKHNRRFAVLFLYELFGRNDGFGRDLIVTDISGRTLRKGKGIKLFVKVFPDFPVLKGIQDL